jgi:diadenosine tetraphosphatase ApaH/serine/threonine PP2A family protein phosphatase
MRYAILSDIHSNLEALNAVVKECQKLKVESYLCGGDIVGYGANPKECIKFFRDNKIPSVAGNHDWAICGRLDASHFTNDGKAAVEWSRPQMSLNDVTYLNELPLSLQNNDFHLVHSSLKEPEQFHYLFDISDALETFSLMDKNICFIGHTHIPTIFLQHQERIFHDSNTEVEIKDDCKYIVNVGSVGQPRDQDPLASFAVYDTNLQMIEIHRVPYAISLAQQKIIQAGLPTSLAERLSKGQ